MNFVTLVWYSDLLGLMVCNLDEWVLSYYDAIYVGRIGKICLIFGTESVINTLSFCKSTESQILKTEFSCET